MNGRQRRVLQDEALYLAAVVAHELGLSESAQARVADAIFTGLVALEDRSVAARLFVAFYRARVSEAREPGVLVGLLRLGELFRAWNALVGVLAARTLRG